MPGPRYEDWSHTHVKGDLDAAAPYVNEARKLLGYVEEDAARMDLGVHSMRRELQDGTVVIAEKHGAIPRMTIIPAPAKQPPPPQVVKDDFVVWARTTALPDGIDEDRPQQILRPAWKTFFDNSDVDGYGAFPGDKGTYGGMFPQGLLHAGNVDWVSPITGERISWYGPSSRYWYDDWRLPRAQYGKHVFHLGQVLLDVDAYADALEEPFLERYVLGAAMTASHLYLVMADLPEAIDTSTPPPTPADNPDGWSTSSYPQGTIPLVLRRFQLAVVPAPPNPMEYTVVGHEDLWDATIARAVAPWVFDADVTTIVSYLPPADAGWQRRGASTWLYPSTTNACLRLDIEAASLSTTAVSLDAGPSVAPLAEENGIVLSIVRKSHGGNPNALHYRIGEHDYVAMAGIGPSEFASYTQYSMRNVVWADLRENALLLRADEYDHATLTITVSFVLCKDGVETALWAETADAGISGQWRDIVKGLLDQFGERAVAPSALAHLNAFGMTPGGLTHNGRAALLLNQYYLFFREAETAGATRFSSNGSSWTNASSKTDLATDIGANTQVDLLGRTTLPGFATYKGYSVFSLQMSRSNINGERIVLAHATASTLAAVTGVPGETTTEAGVAGNDARYHPVWLLGARRRAA